MVSSQRFDALPAPEPAIASDSIQTIEADRVLAEIQALSDGSIGDLVRTERPEGAAASLASAIAVSAIGSVIIRGELAAVGIAALVVSVAWLIAVPSLRTWGWNTR
jgi:hypothetical protein